MIKAIIFDADGVVINGKGFYIPLAEEYGISNEQMKTFFKGEFKKCLLGKANIKEVLPKYLKLWGWKKSVDDFLSFWFEAEHEIDQDLINYIQDLRTAGVQCFMATNQEIFRTEYMLKEMGLDSAFDKIFSSAYIGYKKPQQLFFDHILRDLKGILASEILFWDDSEENVENAKKAGMNSELYLSIRDFKIKMKKYLLLK